MAQLEFIRRLPRVLEALFIHFFRNEYQFTGGKMMPFIDPESCEGFVVNACLSTLIAVGGTPEVVGIEFLHLVVNFTLELMASEATLERRRCDCERPRHICIRFQDIEFKHFALEPLHSQ